MIQDCPNIRYDTGSEEVVVKTNSHPGDPYSLKIEVNDKFWKYGLHLKRSCVKMLHRMQRQMTPGSTHVQLETSLERL